MNTINNPSWTRDLSGKNNPMYGKHPVAWNKDMVGDQSHNWKGGLHKRKDGYYRVRIDGKRVLYHRHLLKTTGIDVSGKVVHHIDHDPSNNDLKNLMVFNSQSDHVKFEHNARRQNPGESVQPTSDTSSGNSR